MMSADIDFVFANKRPINMFSRLSGRHLLLGKKCCFQYNKLHLHPFCLYHFLACCVNLQQPQNRKQCYVIQFQLFQLLQRQNIQQFSNAAQFVYFRQKTVNIKMNEIDSCCSKPQIPDPFFILSKKPWVLSRYHLTKLMPFSKQEFLRFIMILALLEQTFEAWNVKLVCIKQPTIRKLFDLYKALRLYKREDAL